MIRQESMVLGGERLPVYLLYCDVCGERYDEGGATPTEVIGSAFRQGWTLSMELCTCPNCKETPPKGD